MYLERIYKWSEILNWTQKKSKWSELRQLLMYRIDLGTGSQVKIGLSASNFSVLNIDPGIKVCNMEIIIKNVTVGNLLKDTSLLAAIYPFLFPLLPYIHFFKPPQPAHLPTYPGPVRFFFLIFILLYCHVMLVYRFDTFSLTQTLTYAHICYVAQLNTYTLLEPKI